MALYPALWGLLCGLLRPGLRKPRREKEAEGVSAVSRRLNEKYAAEHGLKPILATESDIPLDSPAQRSPWLSSISNLRLAFLLAAAWVGQEWLRSVIFSGWGWNTLGTALHGQLVLIQVAEFTGVAGLSFIHCAM